MVDIDKFKQINDNFGHCIGDDVLKETTAILQKTLILSNHSGFVARYGEDEFYIVLRTKNKSELEQVVYKIKNAVLQYNFATDISHKISCSIGYDVYEPFNRRCL